MEDKQGAKRSICVQCILYIHTTQCVDYTLLPPKLQRRGLVFLVNYYGACMMGYYGCILKVTMEHEEWVTLVYGSYKQVPNSYA